jgi:2-oxoglutarate ferredoxin oxidoreductase subunit alpha
VRGKGNQARKVIKAAPHTDDELIDWNRELKSTYTDIQKNEQRSEMLFTDDASMVVVAFGSSARIALDALTRARQAQKAVGLFRPISLWPYPTDTLRSLAKRGIRKFLVVEANNGQMIEDVRLAVCGDAEVKHYGFGGGHIFSPDEIYEEVCRFY